MIKSISRKMKYLLVAVFAFVLSFTALIVSMPKAKADNTEIMQFYNTQTGDFLEGSTVTKDGRLKWNIPVLENKKRKAVAPGDDPAYSAAFYLKAGETLEFEFNTSGRVLHAINMPLSYLYKADGLIDSETGKTDPNTPYPDFSGDNSATGQLTIECTGYSFTYPENQQFALGLGDDFKDTAPHTTDSLYVRIVNKSGEDAFFVMNNTGAPDDETATMMKYSYEAAPTITVDFDKQGGTGGTSSISADIGSAMPSITLPTKTGYTFNGYYSGKNGTGTKYYNANGSSASNCPSENLKLYAYWIANTYTVKYNGNKPSGASGNVTNIPGNATWTYDSNATLGAAPTLAGYTFGGWYREASCTNKLGNAGQDLTKPNLTSTKGDTVNLYAKWTVNSYTVTLNNNGGTGGSTSVSAKYDSAMPNATMPERFGYDFLGYYDTDEATGGTQYYTSTGASARTWNKTNNTTLYARWEVINDIQPVVSKIDAIGGPNNVSYPTSKDAIIEAESAYNSLIVTHPEYADVDIVVTKHNELLQDRDNYDELRDEAINNVISLINNLGEITYPISHDGIVEAENGYNNLADEDKTYITNYGTLTEARTNYDNQRTEKIQEVINAIDAIGEIEYPTSEEKLYNALDLFTNLLQEDKTNGSITNKDDLEEKEIAYYDLADQAIANVDALISAIESPLVYPKAKEDINAARSAYNNLAIHDQNPTTVEKYNLLLEIETVDVIYNSIKNIEEVEDTASFRNRINNIRCIYDGFDSSIRAYLPDDFLGLLEEYEAIIVVMDAINAIGDVEYTSESKALIDAAQAAYEALDDDLKDDVANYDKLVQANTDYDKVDESVVKINNIPEFEYTSEFKDIIDDARNTYDALTDYQKYIFPQDVLDKLLDAEEKYDAIDKITNIGKIENTKESRDRVKKAKEAYDALDEDQKQIVSDEALKNLNDAVAIVDVIEEVNSVKNAGYTTKDKENIDATRTSYNALTEDQKELFPANTLEMLTNIEKTYPVMVSINQLGNVQYTSEFKNKLDTIKEIYDSLTAEQKDLVRNYVVLSVDEQSYNRVDAAYKAIEAIDKVKYNSSSKEAIDDARKCYNKLNDDEKELIPDEEEKLIQAEKKYEKAEHSHNVGMTWLKVICIILGIAILLLGIFFLIILLKRRKKEEEDEEEKNNKKSRK